MSEPIKAPLTKEESDFAAAQEFAKIQERRLNDLNKNITETQTTYTRFTKKQIMSFMQNPANNAKNLRNASIYMADVSVQYDRLLSYFSTLYKMVYTVSPVAFDGKVQKKTMETSYFQSLSLLEKLDLPHLAPMIIKTVLREGVFFGAIWQGTYNIVIQKINPDYCRLSHMIDGTWQYSIDMSQIREKKLFMYPPEFTVMYNAYKAGEGKWQPVPAKISFCLKADESTTAYSKPTFAGSLGLLYDIEQYKALQETGAEISNYKLLNMEIPLNADGTPQLDYTLAQKYYNQLCGVLPPYIGASISPMKLSDYKFERSGTADQVDIVARAEDGYWTGNGTSALLHGSNVGKTAGAIKLSIKSDESFVDPIVKQLQSVVNKMLRDQTSAIQKFKINILPVTIFNQDEMVKYYKEAATLGIPGSKSAYAAILDMPAYDLVGVDFVEQNYLNLNDLTPLQSGYTTSKADPGRPAKDDTELDGAGEETRGADSNASR